MIISTNKQAFFNLHERNVGFSSQSIHWESSNKKWNTHSQQYHNLLPYHTPNLYYLLYKPRRTDRVIKTRNTHLIPRSDHLHGNTFINRMINVLTFSITTYHTSSHLYQINKHLYKSEKHEQSITRFTDFYENTVLNRIISILYSWYFLPEFLILFTRQNKRL